MPKLGCNDLRRVCRLAARLCDVPIAGVRTRTAAGEFRIETLAGADPSDAHRLYVWASAPLCTSSGEDLGELFLGGFTEPEQPLTSEDQHSLQELASLSAEAVCRTPASDQRRSDEALTEANQNLRTLLTASPVAIVALSTEGLITLWNPAAERVFGWSEAEVLGKPLPFIPEEKLGEHRSMRARDLRGEHFSNLELRRKRKDGSSIDISVSTAPLLNAKGVMTGLISLYIDVTEQNRIQNALKESEEWYRLMAAAVPQMVWTARTDGSLDFVNTRGTDYFSTDPNSLAGSGWLVHVHPDDAARTLEEWSRAIRTGEVYENNFRLRRASDGMYRWHLVRALPFRDSRGEIVKWLGTCTDIQDHKEVEAELRRANQDLEQFAYSASHDLQEPLRQVSAFTQLLQRKCAGVIDSDAERFVQYIVSGAQRMELLVRDLLIYTRAAHLSQSPSKKVNSRTVLDGVLLDLRAAIDESKAEIQADPLPFVFVEEVHLVQIFQNIVGNALKYRGDETPRIRIAAEREADMWRFSVKDNGIGVEPKYHQQIFGLFKRLHASSRYEGTGIGLAICQKTVERYGGTISIQSEGLGKGSKFMFTLPG